MACNSPTCAARIESLKTENSALRDYIRRLEERLGGEPSTSTAPCNPTTAEGKNKPNLTSPSEATAAAAPSHGHPSTLRVELGGSLNKDQVERLSRQILLPEVTSDRCGRLTKARVLIVGAGGLGSTAGLYLAAGGIGTITIVDFDVVERSNLHRQIIHSDDRQGLPKAVSAKMSMLAINPNITVNTVLEPFGEENAVRLAIDHDVVVDCSDNVACRYLVNDACVVAGKPLVSGAAMRWEGQLTVYNAADKTPCYRCLFPRPPPRSTVGSCNDVGVMGPLPGLIGCLQALEVLKVVMGHDSSKLMAGKMLMVQGFTNRFMVVKLRERNPECTLCSHATVAALREMWDMARLSSGSQLPSSASVVQCLSEYMGCEKPEALPAVVQVSPEAWWGSVGSGGTVQREGEEEEGKGRQHIRHVTVDVREQIQHEMARLEGPNEVQQEEGNTVGGHRSRLVVHYPMSKMTTNPEGLFDVVKQAEAMKEVHNSTSSGGVAGSGGAVGHRPTTVLYMLCRRGIFSSKATKLLLEAYGGQSTPTQRATTTPTAAASSSGSTPVEAPPVTTAGLKRERGEGETDQEGKGRQASGASVDEPHVMERNGVVAYEGRDYLVRNVVGGLTAFAKRVNPDFPLY